MKETKTATPGKIATHFIPTSRLKSYSIVNERGAEIGQVERIIVDMVSGRVAYMLVGLEGHLNDRWVAVPPDILTWRADHSDFMLDVTEKSLDEAPTIARRDWPDKFLADLEKTDHAAWVEDVYAYYDTTPFWVIVED